MTCLSHAVVCTNDPRSSAAYRKIHPAIVGMRNLPDFPYRPTRITLVIPDNRHVNGGILGYKRPDLEWITPGKPGCVAARSFKYRHRSANGRNVLRREDFSTRHGVATR